MTPDSFRTNLAKLIVEPPSLIAPFEPSLANFQSLLDQTDESEKLVRAIFAAGILAFGELSAVETILEYAPNVAPNTATGILIAAPSYSLTIMLPLPTGMGTSIRTVINREVFLEWYAQNRSSLVLDKETGRFKLSPLK